MATRIFDISSRINFSRVRNKTVEELLKSDEGKNLLIRYKNRYSWVEYTSEINDVLDRHNPKYKQRRFVPSKYDKKRAALIQEKLRLRIKIEELVASEKIDKHLRRIDSIQSESNNKITSLRAKLRDLDKISPLPLVRSKKEKRGKDPKMVMAGKKAYITRLRNKFNKV